MIKALKQDGITQFKGKQTTVNLTQGEPGSLLAAKNVMVLSDGQLRRAPGYTKVASVGGGPVQAIWDFQRDVDQKQFVFVQSGGVIHAMNADGTGLLELSEGELGTHQFVANAFIAYSSDGHNAWRYVDKAGTLTKYKWGIAPPATAPAISLSAGTLTLTYGRTYCYCDVSKYTDSLGIERLSIGAPSPISAHTGPIANQVVTLSTLAVSTDAQVTHKWIFATSDSPADTSATYYFAAEITNATTSWGDTLDDDALDQTRLAPFDNNPAPAAAMLTSFQNRIVAGNGSLMQLSGNDEITLGIPEEAWPLSLFFNVPSGKRTISALAAMQEGTVLQVSTQDFWYSYTGYDASTFQEQDRVASPGAAGPLAAVLTPEGLIYLSANQSVRVWKGVGPQPTSISDQISKSLTGSYAMEDIDPAKIGSSACLWYDFGPMNMLVVFARTKFADPAKAGWDLMQLWSFTTEAHDLSGMYGAGQGVYTQLTGTYETDKLPSVYLTAAGSVDVGFAGQNYLYVGDALGNVYRWPDGFLDDTTAYPGAAQLAWARPSEGQNRFYWVDVDTDRSDSLAAFQVSAAAADAPDQTLVPVGLSTLQRPNPRNPSPKAIRALMNADGVATGRFVSLWLQFPQDNNDAAVSELILSSRPLNTGIA
jgi:hypothetical protein